MRLISRISKIIISIYTLVAVSLIFLAGSTLAEAQASFGDHYFFIKKQLLWIFVGSMVLFVVSRLKFTYLKKITTPLYLLSTLLLVIVLIPGFSTTILGARRWLSLGFFAIQPTEIFKLAAIFYFAKLISHPSKNSLKNILLALLPPLILIILQPNMSSVVLITAVIFSLYYLGNGNITQLLTLTSVFAAVGLVLILFSPYRHARLQTLLSPHDDASRSGYHTNQIVLSLSSGGLFGKGLGNSNHKYQYLPELATDSILAVIGEELGFFGIFLILLLYYFLITSIFKVAKLATDPFDQLIIMGVGLWISYQTIINTAAIAVLVPLTGVPLPFISYGGSSLLTLFAAIGLVVNRQMKYTPVDDNQINPYHRQPSHPGHRIDPSAKKRFPNSLASKLHQRRF
ncbi:putative lipid II flippase FtsW [Patescibacteria group bacterium]|nr:putative lipid II flippase FtsW [Patescibacteria group bacterium]